MTTLTNIRFTATQSATIAKLLALKENVGLPVSFTAGYGRAIHVQFVGGAGYLVGGRGVAKKEALPK
jgi:hypothetical protein